MKRLFLLIFPGLAVLLADRLVKHLTVDSAGRVLIPGALALHPTRNTGMAMGLFQDNTLLILIASIVLIGACVWLLRDVRLNGLALAAVSMIAGGALGNMIDRVALGSVIDMFELLFMDFYIFNVADVGVVCGAILCGMSLLFRPQDWSKREK